MEAGMTVETEAEAKLENLPQARRGRKIPLDVRLRILSDSLKPGCVISDLAKLHGISARIIYRWRHKEKQKLNQIASGSTNKFIELSLCDTEGISSASSNNYTSAFKDNTNGAVGGNRLMRGGSTLSKVSLIFEDLALTITLEGRIKGDLLAVVVKALEGGEVQC